MADRLLTRAVACANNTRQAALLFVATIAALGELVAWREHWPWADGLWWAWVTATTTGYGDLSPATLTGRLAAVVLMVVGLVGIGLIVGRIAAVVIKTRDAWTHEEQEASREREAHTLALLEELATRERTQ